MLSHSAEHTYDEEFDLSSLKKAFEGNKLFLNFCCKHMSANWLLINA